MFEFEKNVILYRSTIVNFLFIFLPLQAKIHYLDIISGLPSYGAKCFSTNQRDGIERVLLISPRFGLSQIAGVRNSVVSTLYNILLYI